MKSAAFILILLLAQNVMAWSWDTHRFITKKAISVLPQEESRAFNDMEHQIVDASILPDQLRDEGMDSVENHLYNPDTNEGTAPMAIESWYDKLVKDLSEEKTEDASKDAGMLSHYIQDISLPLHTGSYVDEHASIEAYINESLDKIFISVSEKDVLYVSDVKTFAIETAEESAKDFDSLVEAYRSDNLAKVGNLAEKSINRSIANTASLLHSAMKDSGYIEKEKKDSFPLRKILSEISNFFLTWRRPLTILAIILIFIMWVMSNKKK